MTKVKLARLAHARSGDKGPDSNVGLIAYSKQAYDLLKQEATEDRVRAYFQGLVAGDVQRFELDNLWALNFILGDSLGGGGSESLLNDAQGKTHAQKLLQMEVDVPEDFPVPQEHPH